MHLMQHLSHHLRKQTPLSRLTYGRAKGSNLALTRNQRISIKTWIFMFSEG